MMSAMDPHTDWDAAYVLGALSSAERREFEQHLARCAQCATAVAELVALPGLLARVPEGDLDVSAVPLPPSLLPRLIRATRTHRRRVRMLLGGIVAAVAAGTAALVLAIPLMLQPVAPVSTSAPVPTQQLTLSQVAASPLTADVHLVSLGWGTRIDMTCRYAEAAPTGGYSATSSDYALYVTDAAGVTAQVASWTSAPGTTAKPSGTTSLHVDQIRSVEVRSLASGNVLLRGELGGIVR